MSEYFSHDYNARNDLNMKKLFMGEGLAGIGLYWCIVEMLYEKGGYIELDYIPIIAFDLRTTDEMVNNVINKYGLFSCNETHFYSDGVLKRLNMRAEKSEKARKSIEARWKKAKANNADDTDEIRPYNESNTIKEKERKENENKVNKNTDCEAIIEYLNARLNTKYKATSKTTQKHINARLNEGFTVDDFKTVIDKKMAEWKGTEMEQYLRPETLFGTKFESYLNATINKPANKPYRNQDNGVLDADFAALFDDLNTVDL